MNPSELESEHLMKLLYLSKRLTQFESAVDDIRRSINEILESDSDMANMYLSTKAETGYSRRIDQHDEIELLLEAYLKQVDEIAAQVAQLRFNIRDTEDIININLDTQRNTMMRLELQLAMGTFSAAAWGLIGTAFGAPRRGGRGRGCCSAECADPRAQA